MLCQPVKLLWQQIYKITPPKLWFTCLALSAVLGSVGPTAAEVLPAKPYADVVAEVIGFLYSDVGNGGIRTNDNDPEGYPVPPYFYHYAVRDGNGLWSNLDGYPGYAAVSYPAYTACVAIDAFLDWRRWSGDETGLVRARQYADWILEHRTPSGDLYGHLPYSTQTDAIMGGGWDGAANMTDKPPMFGLRLLRLYDITGEQTYLDGALEIAATMTATQWSGDSEDDGRWPFRTIPADGTVTQDYTSHLMPAVRFFTDLAARTKDPLHTQAAERAWSWLLANPGNPAAVNYMRWEAFYEDQSPQMQTGLGDHYSAHEMIVELSERRPAGWEDLASTILDTVDARYLVQDGGAVYGDYVPVTLEWTGWPEATYASSLQYARTALLLYQALEGDPRQSAAWQTTALAMAAVCSHGQNNRGLAADGRMFTTIRDLVTYFNVDSWYEQNFNTVIYFLEIMGLVPELAPDGENHILSAQRALTSVAYPGDGVLVSYTTVGSEGQERLKLSHKPGTVLADGISLSELPTLPLVADGWHWDPVAQVATVQHTGTVVEILSNVSGVADDLTGQRRRPILKLTGQGVTTTGRLTIGVDLAQNGALTLEVFDLRGLRVRSLASSQWLTAGGHEFSWDGRNGQGRLAASGIYLVRGRMANAKDTTRIRWVR